MRLILEVLCDYFGKLAFHLTINLWGQVGSFDLWGQMTPLPPAGAISPLGSNDPFAPFTARR